MAEITLKCEKGYEICCPMCGTPGSKSTVRYPDAQAPGENWIQCVKCGTGYKDYGALPEEVEAMLTFDPMEWGDAELERWNGVVTGRDMDVQLLTPKVDVGVIVPEDKAEPGVFIADGETEDGMTILTSVEEKEEPKE